MSGSLRRGLLALTLAGLAARLLWVALEPPTFPVADETMWISWARTLLSPEGAFSPLRLRFVFHPPLYLYFMGVPFALFGSLAAVSTHSASSGPSSCRRWACSGGASSARRPASSPRGWRPTIPSSSGSRRTSGPRPSSP